MDEVFSMNPSHPIDPEQLLEHASWAHRLARSLVGEAAAEDLVQDTWLAALRRPPSGDRPLRPWLGTVLGNLARERARRRSRRQAREEAGSRPEGLPSAAELTERTESQRLLMEALLELEPASRQLVLLRFVEEHSAAAIGRELGLPASTVKSRLERGLAELRARLDEKHGGRESWSLALLPLLRLPKAAGLGSGVLATSLNLIVMKLLSAPFVLVALLLALAGGFVTWGPLGLFDSSPKREVVHFAMLVPESARGMPVVSEAQPPLRDLVSSAPAASAVDEESCLLRARFLDVAGQPVAGVDVTAGARKMGFVGRSADQGVVELEACFHSDRETHTVRFRCAGFAADSRLVEFVHGETLDLGDIVLRAGGDLRGLVVDEAGRPLEGASVRVRGEAIVTTTGSSRTMTSTGVGAVEARTDEQGRFELRGLLAGDVRVKADAEGELYSGESGLVEIRAGELTSGLVIVAPRTPDARLIEGVVVDPDGVPVPHCRVLAVYHSGSSTGTTGTSTDDEGRFRFRTSGRGVYDLTFKPGVGSGVEGLEKPGVPPGALGLRIELERGLEQAVRVVDPSGAPVGSYAVRVMPEGSSGASSVFGEDARPEGRMVLSLPSGRSTVVVLAPGFFEGRLEGVAAVEGSAPLEIVLHRMPGVAGTVRADGEPVAGAAVFLQRVASDRVTFNGFPARFDGRAAESTETDELGSWRLDLRTAGRFVVRIEKQRFAPLELGPFEVDPALGLERQDVELGPGGTLVVRVHGAPGAIASGAIVAISRGDCFARTARADGEGVARFEHLVPGPWMATLWAEEIGETFSSTSESPSVPYTSVPSNTEVRAGQTTVLELWQEGRSSCRVEGRVALEGVDLEGWSASLSSELEGVKSRRFVEARIDSGGRFDLEADQPGDYRIAIVEPGERKWRFDVVVALEPGALVWEEQWGAARVELVAVQDFRVALSVTMGSGTKASRMVNVGAGEVVVLEGVPAGELRLIGFPKGKGRSERGFDRTLELEPGGFERIELP
jgi:RNA polymerase sigma-70 factor (ECF subfamily)